MHGPFSRRAGVRPGFRSGLPLYSAPRPNTTFTAADILALAPAAWFRFNVGVAVSQWTDQSGNNRHLLQATGGNQPTLPGDGSVLFDGVAQFMKCSAFTLNQPVTMYLLINPISWTVSDKFCDGTAANTLAIEQITGTPQVRFRAGSAMGNISPTLGTYSVITVQSNGASGVLQLNNTSPVTGNGGASNPGGFTLGADGGGTTNFGNVQVKEVIIYPVAHDSTTRSRVIAYLAGVGGLSI